MSRVWRLAIVLALFTMACRAEANIILEVAEDSSGTFTAELGMDDEFRTLLALGTDFLGGAEDLNLPGDIDITNLDQLDQRIVDDMTFFSNTTTFTDIEALEQTLLDQAGQAATFDEFDLTVDEEGAVLIAKASLPTGDALDPASLPIDLDQLESNFSASVIATLPGDIVEENADTVSDGQLQWNIDITQGVDIEARTTFGGSGFPFWLLVVAVLIVAAAGGLLLFFNRDRATSTKALAGVAAPPPPEGFTTGADGAPDRDAR